MSVRVTRAPAGPKSPRASREDDSSAQSENSASESPSPTTQSQSRAIKPGHAKWTRSQFSPYSYPRTRRSRRNGLASGAKTDGIGVEDPALPGVSTSDQARRLAAGRQTCGESESTSPPLRLHALSASQHPPNAAVLISATQPNLGDQPTTVLEEMINTAPLGAGPASVPRKFDYTDLSFSTGESEEDEAPDMPKVSTNVTGRRREPGASPKMQSPSNDLAYRLAQPITKRDPSSSQILSRTQPRTETVILDSGTSREIIYIDSSSDSSDDDSFPPIQRLIRAEFSSDAPTTKPPATSVEDTLSPKMDEDTFMAQGDESASGEKGLLDDAPMLKDNEPVAVENEFLEDIPMVQEGSVTVQNQSLDDAPMITDDEPAAVENVSLEDAPMVQEESVTVQNEYLEDAPMVSDDEAADVENVSLEDDPMVSDDESVSLEDTPMVHIEPAIVEHQSLEDDSMVDDESASAEEESLEDSPPFSVFRRSRDRTNQQLIDDDEETEFAMVNRPLTPCRTTAPPRRYQKEFDADAFDSIIYSQSQMHPPEGVSIRRPSTPSALAAHDNRLFVAGNPAIHRSVVRTDKWWKDKIREICNRPSRKQWFGRAAERMQWLYNKQLEEDMKRRHQQTDGFAGRKTREDPQPAGYNRRMDFGDVAECDLPPEVLNNPAWVKGCEWMRKNGKEEAKLQRIVEHSTQTTWQHYQNILNESDD